MQKEHININRKADCCGCTACVSICPKQCISFSTDEYGCGYPVVNEDICIKCGACISVCPFKHVLDKAEPLECFAAWNNNESARLKSSSGGVFIALARKVIECGGAVCGAVFTEQWGVKHTVARTLPEVAPMMGSKYLQSSIDTVYPEVKKLLKENVEVLFTGTPCQVSGLKHYLRKDYDNLLCVEVICHGVPMPRVWQSYLGEQVARTQCGRPSAKYGFDSHLNAQISYISFRDKRNGWKKFGFDLHLASGIRGEKNSVLTSLNAENTSLYEVFPDNPYMQVFLRNWSLRPSCYDCQAKSGHSHADLTIGDYWGVERTTHEDDDRGLSCVICRSEKGLKAINALSDVSKEDSSYDLIVKSNPAIEKSVEFSENARRFQRLFPRKGFFKTKQMVESPSVMYRGLRFIKRKLRIKG